MTVGGQGEPAFERIGPAGAPTPLVLSVPHAGRHYPPALLADSAVPRSTLEDLEDRHADLLVARAVATGGVAIVARVARAWIDLNRAETDCTPPPGGSQPVGTVASMRARMGLGLVPHRLGRRELWRRPPDAAAVAARIATVHEPYHTAVADALAQAVARHGHAVLIDCHSMPPLAGPRAPRVVIGDRHGRTAARGLAARLATTAREAGYPAAVNAPYAGAYAIERHGRPDQDVHAVQIEIDRTLYLMPDMRAVGSGLDDMRRVIAMLAWEAVAATRPSMSIAAE